MDLDIRNHLKRGIPPKFEKNLLSTDKNTRICKKRFPLLLQFGGSSVGRGQFLNNVKLRGTLLYSTVLEFEDQKESS